VRVIFPLVNVWTDLGGMQWWVDQVRGCTILIVVLHSCHPPAVLLESGHPSCLSSAPHALPVTPGLPHTQEASMLGAASSWRSCRCRHNAVACRCWGPASPWSCSTRTPRSRRCAIGESRRCSLSVSPQPPADAPGSESAGLCSSRRLRYRSQYLRLVAGFQGLCQDDPDAQEHHHGHRVQQDLTRDSADLWKEGLC